MKQQRTQYTLERDKTGDAVGRPSRRSSFLDGPSAKFLGRKRKLTKFREHLSQGR
jgi:hypothetical protein